MNGPPTVPVRKRYLSQPNINTVDLEQTSDGINQEPVVEMPKPMMPKPVMPIQMNNLETKKPSGMLIAVMVIHVIILACIVIFGLMAAQNTGDVEVFGVAISPSISTVILIVACVAVVADTILTWQLQ